MAKKKKISIEKVFPFDRSKVWQALTNKEQVSQWLMKTDIEPIVGKKFTFQAEPMKGWRGWVECEVLEVIAETKIVYSWQGDVTHSITTVSYELFERGEETLVIATHSGFDKSHGFLSGLILRRILLAGWKKMFTKLSISVLGAA